MGSWITCVCGGQIHKNLFAGAKVHVLVLEDVLNAIPDDMTAADAVVHLIQNGEIVVKCPSCGRVAIEDKSTGAVSFYSRERD